MPQDPISLRTFITELKRRRVFRVIAAYAVVAWVATEVTATVAPALHLPEWTLTLVVLLAIIGFPVAAILAWAYDITPDGVQRAPSGGSLPLRRAAALALVIVMLGATGWAGLRLRPQAEPPPESNLVVVLPFRVSADASLDYLREGMLDLLAAKLSGDVGAAAVDPRTVLNAWQRAGGGDGADLAQDDALEVARGLGARSLLLGEVVSVPPRLSLSARLVDVRDGSVVYRASVDGPADSLPALVDRLAAQLLLVQAGEAEHRLVAATSTSLPALTSYLQGQTLFRQGRIEEALERYLYAIELDSTFALAALGAWSAQVWGIARPGVTERAQELAWANRARLSERDRLHLIALGGPDFPDESTATRRLEAAQRAVSAAPDRPELWYHYGDVLTHDGARLGVPEWRSEAIAAFRRAGELGPMTSEAIVHLLDLLVDAGDTATARRYGEAYIAESEDGEVPRYLRWLLQAAAGEIDPAARVAPLPWRINRWVVQNAQLLGPGYVEDAERALVELQRAQQPQAERASSLRAITGTLLNAGRPAEAARALDALAALGPERVGIAHRWRIFFALYWDGPADAAASAAAALEPRVVAAAADDDARNRQALELCALEQWRVAQGQRDRTAETTRRLREPGAASGGYYERYARVCAALLDALTAEASGRDMRVAADRLQADFDEHLPYYSFDPLFAAVPLVMARLRESHGDVAAALSWTRRRPGAGSTQHVLLSTYLREEGRLAELANDRDAAIRAYTHYLALRARPEPGLAESADGVRQALASLTREVR